MQKLLKITDLYSSGNVRNENETELVELAQNIETYGLLQPLTVRKGNNGKYEIIAGHRRFEALKMINENFIECNIIEDASDKDCFFMQVSENIQRKNMSAFELVEVFKKMKTEYKMKSEHIAKVFNRSKAWVDSQFVAVNILEREFGGNIPEKKKKMSASVIMAEKKNKRRGDFRTVDGKGFSARIRGHSYMINCGDFNFEEALNDFIKEWSR